MPITSGPRAKCRFAASRPRICASRLGDLVGTGDAQRRGRRREARKDGAQNRPALGDRREIGVGGRLRGHRQAGVGEVARRVAGRSRHACRCACRTLRRSRSCGSSRDARAGRPSESCRSPSGPAVPPGRSKAARRRTAATGSVMWRSRKRAKTRSKGAPATVSRARQVGGDEVELRAFVAPEPGQHLRAEAGVDVEAGHVPRRVRRAGRSGASPRPGRSPHRGSACRARPRRRSAPGASPAPTASPAAASDRTRPRFDRGCSRPAPRPCSVSWAGGRLLLQGGGTKGNETVSMRSRRLHRPARAPSPGSGRPPPGRPLRVLPAGVPLPFPRAAATRRASTISCKGLTCGLARDHLFRAASPSDASPSTRPPAVSMKATISGTPTPSRTWANWNGRSPRIRRESRSMTSSEAPT